MSAPQRYGMTIRLRTDKREEYLALHAAVWPDVEAALIANNVRNFSIFRHGDVLFGYWAPMSEVWHLQ